MPNPTAAEGAAHESRESPQLVDTAWLAREIAALLGDRTVACAESCTAGRVSEAFAAVEGASDWFRGGLVAYQVPVKRAMLGVQAESMLSEHAAAEMAIGIAALLDAEASIATTGVAGDKPGSKEARTRSAMQRGTVRWGCCSATSGELAETGRRSEGLTRSGERPLS